VPPKNRDDKAHDNAGRAKQAQKQVLKVLQKSRPEFTDADIEVVWTQQSVGDGDWKALVMVNGVENTVYLVGYNYDADQLYVDAYQQAERHN
jgi:hypothetical protein